MTYDFQITADTPEAMQFLENMRTLPFVREIRRRRSRRADPAPPCRYSSVEELRAGVLQGLEDSLAGRVTSQEDLEKEIRTWWK